MDKQWVKRAIHQGGRWFANVVMSVAIFAPALMAEESKTFVNVPPPKGAVLLDEIVSESGEYQVMLAPIKRLIGQMQTDRSQSVAGQRTFGTWEWSRKGTLDSVIRHFDKYINSQDVIFRCTGRDCGANQLWANEIFDVARLVGRDSKQFYLVAKHHSPNNKTVAFDLVYAVQRNRHLIMIHVERVAGELVQ